VEVSLHTFVTSALDGCEWSASSSDRFDLGEGLPVPNRTTLGGSQRRSKPM